jgi:hypothetical protein
MTEIGEAEAGDSTSSFIVRFVGVGDDAGNSCASICLSAAIARIPVEKKVNNRMVFLYQWLELISVAPDLQIGHSAAIGESNLAEFRQQDENHGFHQGASVVLSPKYELFLICQFPRLPSACVERHLPFSDASPFPGFCDG